MVILIIHRHCVAIKFPGLSILVELHIMLGARHYNFSFLSIEFELVTFAIVTDTVKTALKAALRVGEYKGIISNTNKGYAEGSNIETKLRVVEGSEERIDVHFEVLPVSLLLLKPPA